MCKNVLIFKCNCAKTTTFLSQRNKRNKTFPKINFKYIQSSCSEFKLETIIYGFQTSNIYQSFNCLVLKSLKENNEVKFVVNILHCLYNEGKINCVPLSKQNRFLRLCGRPVVWRQSIRFQMHSVGQNLLPLNQRSVCT